MLGMRGPLWVRGILGMRGMLGMRGSHFSAGSPLWVRHSELWRGLVAASSSWSRFDLHDCARGELVNTADMVAALKSGKVGGYGADVLDEEPPSPDHPLLSAPNCVLTPHIGSRTHESVQRQAMMATQNLLLCLEGKKPLAQVNTVPVPALS